jgi:hypothetical protein
VSVETAKTALAVKLDAESWRLAGLTDRLGGWVRPGLGRDAAKLIVPVKLLMLARSSLKLVDSPAWRIVVAVDDASSK